MVFPPCQTHPLSFKSTIFKTITDEATGSKKIVNSLFEQIKKIKEVGIKGWLNTSDIDLDLINAYNKAIETSTDKQATMAQYTSNTNKATADLINSTKGAVVSEKARTAALNASTIAAKASALATKALQVALSTLASIGISMAINGIITLITKLVNAEQEAKQQAVENAKAYENQKTELESLKQKYIEIMDSEESESVKAEKLDSIKKTLAETYGLEKEALDKLNKSRKEGLDLLDNEALKNAQDVINKNQQKYEQYTKEAFDVETSYISEGWYNISKQGEDKILSQFGIRAYNNSTWWNPFDEDDSANFEFGKNVYDAYDNIKEALSYYNDLELKYGELTETQSKIKDVLKRSFNKLDDYLYDSESGIDSVLSSTADAYWTKYRIAFEESQKVAFDDIDTTEGLENWKKDFYESLGEFADDPYFKSYVEKIFADKLNQISKAIGNSGEKLSLPLDLTEFNKKLDETKEKLETLITTASKVKSALKTAFSKDTFSVEDVLELTELMPKLSDKFVMNEDGTFSIDYDDLKAGAEEYIKTQQNEIDKTNELIQAKIDELEANIALNKSKMSGASIGSKSDYEYYQSAIDADKASVDELKSKLDNNKIYSQYLSNAAKDLSTSFSDVIEILTDRSNVISDVENSITENGTITLEVLNKIKDAYPELENDVANYLMGLIDEQSLLSKLNKAYDDSLYKYRFAVAQKVELTDEELQSYLDVLNTKYAEDENYYANLGALGENFINYMKSNYDIDLQNCKTWNDAKLKMQQETMAKITALAGGVNIKDYYDFETGKKIGNWSDLYSNAGLVNSGVLSQIVDILSDYGDGIQEFGKLFKSADALDGISKSTSNSTKSTTNEVFDWIEVRLNRLADKTKSFFDKVSDYVSNITNERNLGKAINSTQKEIDANKKAEQKYRQKANSINLSEGWKKKVRDGNFSIDELTNETLIKNIQDYQKWWEKAKESSKNIYTLTEQKKDYLSQQFDSKYERQQRVTDRYTTANDKINDQISYKEAKGKKVTTSDYNSLNKNLGEQNKSLNIQNKLLINQQKTVEKGSAKWQEYQDKIDNNSQTIRQNTETIAENNNKKFEIKIADYERSANNYANKVETKQNSIDLAQAQGKKVGTSFYKDMISYTNSQNSILNSEKKAIEQELKTVEYGSERYDELIDKLRTVDSTINSNKINQAEWNAEIRNIPIKNIRDYLDIVDAAVAKTKSYVERLSYINGESTITADLVKSQKYSEQAMKSQKELYQKYLDEYYKAKSEGRTADAEEAQKSYLQEAQAYNEMLVTNEEIDRQARDILLYRNYEQDLQHIEDVKKALNSLEGMLNDNALYNEDGSFSNQGIAKIALTINQLEQARASVADYKSEIDALNKAHEDGSYNDDEYAEKLRELTEGYQGATSEVNQYIDAIKDLYKNQAQEELNVLNELIETRQEALEKKKSYYDYDRTIRNKTKDITAMQMQIEALNGVSTAEAKAQKALLQEQIQGLEEDLADTQAEHIYQMQIDGLNEQKEILQDIYDTFIDSLNKCIDTEQEIISSATYLAVNSVQAVNDLLKEIANARGYDINYIGDTLPHFADGGLVKSRGKDDGLAWLKAGEYVLNENAYKAFKYSIPAIDSAANKMTQILGHIDDDRFGKSFSIGDINLVVQGNVDKSVMSDLKKYQKQLTDSVISTITKDLIKTGYKR